MSLLAQKVTTVCGKDMNQAINLLVAMKEEATQSRARLWYQRILENKLVVLTFFDASLGKEDAGKFQLAAAHFVAHEDTVKRPAAASLMDFTTNKSTRVVRSSVAAEACAMCLTADGHLKMRLVLYIMLTGSQQIPEQWRKKLAIRGSLVVDAHCLPSERETLLDVSVCENLVENGVRQAQRQCRKVRMKASNSGEGLYAAPFLGMGTRHGLVPRSGSSRAQQHPRDTSNSNRHIATHATRPAAIPMAQCHSRDTLGAAIPVTQRHSCDTPEDPSSGTKLTSPNQTQNPAYKMKRFGCLSRNINIEKMNARTPPRPLRQC